MTEKPYLNLVSRKIPSIAVLHDEKPDVTKDDIAARELICVLKDGKFRFVDVLHVQGKMRFDDEKDAWDFEVIPSLIVYGWRQNGRFPPKEKVREAAECAFRDGKVSHYYEEISDGQLRGAIHLGEEQIKNAEFEE